MEQQEPTIALRWKTIKQNHIEPRAKTVSNQSSIVWGNDQSKGGGFTAQQVFDDSGRSAVFDKKPLHYQSATKIASVRPANYQAGSSSDPLNDRVNQQDLAFPDLNNEPGSTTSPQSQAESIAPDNISPRAEIPSLPDPLDIPEDAPGPNSILEGDAQENPRSNPFDDVEDRSRSDLDDRGQAEVVPLPGESDDVDPDLDLPNRRDDTSSITCNELRERVRARPLKDVTLDVSPTYGEGMRSAITDTEEQRLEFAATSALRDWNDYKNLHIATGRLIDLRDDRVVLDVDGVEKYIALQDLSDADIAYVGDAWNVPLRCGSGNEPFAGRSYISSTVQWKAPGQCHKPLYFEQIQLERYGHDAGPVMQPLLSTAHFFANIAVLPYKMGIHPPNECQYSLGYFRPGNCAPYMVQPIPLSLRGAAAQAGFVTGAAALIP